MTNEVHLRYVINSDDIHIANVMRGCPNHDRPRAFDRHVKAIIWISV
jgi:hypothetical protein